MPQAVSCTEGSCYRPAPQSSIFISETVGMTTDYNSKKRDESGSNASSIGEKVPKFFKIVSNPGVYRLRLPPEFMRRYGNNLPDCLSLKVPTGLVWKVELIHSNREAWLHRGWQEFEEYYSLGFGHFLLFTYVGNSHFEVHIFDTTATEIEYSYYDSLDREAGMNQVAIIEGVESESDDSVVFLKEIFAGKNVERKHQDVDDDTKTNIYIQVIDDSNPPPKREKKRRMQESDGLSSEKLRRSSRGEQNSSCPVRKERRMQESDGVRSEKLRRSSRGEQNSSCPVKKEPRFLDSSPNQIDEHNEGTKLKYPDKKQVQHLEPSSNSIGGRLRERRHAQPEVLCSSDEQETCTNKNSVASETSLKSTKKRAQPEPSTDSIGGRLREKRRENLTNSRTN